MAFSKEGEHMSVGIGRCLVSIWDSLRRKSGLTGAELFEHGTSQRSITGGESSPITVGKALGNIEGKPP